jgi:hypothetical protein
MYDMVPQIYLPSEGSYALDFYCPQKAIDLSWFCTREW